MGKKRIDCLIFGYRRVTVLEEDIDKTVGLLLRSGLPTSFFPDGSFIIRERDAKSVFKILDGKVRYNASKTLGLYGHIVGISHKIAFVLSVCFIILLCFLSENVIWDIKVSGNDRINDSEIIYELKKCGMAIGDAWWLIERSDVENKILCEYPNIAWININRRGSVAYVEVLEKDGVKREENITSHYTNIVAVEDCIIEEITVKSGFAVVEVGDIVKKGDLLISGIIPLEMGGGFCNASGKVVGRVSDRVEVIVPRKSEEKNIKKEQLNEITLNFFDFPINIFKKYRNLADECVIIEEKEIFSHGEKKKLPFSISRKYTYEYEFSEKVYSDSEITLLAGRRLSALLFSRLVNADLVKIRTYGKFTESEYKTYSDFVFCADVGGALEYHVE